MLPEQANIRSVQGARRREEVQVPAAGVTSLVLGTNGGMGNECQRFLKRLADKIAQKDIEQDRAILRL